MFEKLKAVILAAGGIIALIPGAGLLIGELKLPAPFDDLLGLMAAIVGPIVFFLVILAGPWIQRQNRGILIGAIAALGLAGLSIGYYTNDYAQGRMGKYSYIKDGKETVERYLVPEKSEVKEDLKGRIVRESGSITNAINRDREGTLMLLRRDASSVRLKLVSRFLLAQAMIIIAFATAAWAVTAGRNPSRAPTLEPPTS